jgi:Zn-dependent protease with chaperone function
VRFDPSLPDEGLNVSRTHPVREALVLVAGISAGVTLLFVLLAFVIEIAVPWIPPDFEARVFALSWLRSEPDGDAGAGDDPRGNAVSHLLDRIAEHWPENPYPLRVAVYEEPVPNAVAFPGGLVVVTSGLLEQVESENELAFVLAHELGHFRNRDHLRGIGRGLAYALVLGTLGLGSSGGVAQLATLSGGLAARAFDRDQESEADRFALEIVAKEYGHVAGALDFFGRSRDPNGAVGKEITHYFATHPLNEDRTTTLRSLARERGWASAGEPLPWRIE